MLHRLRSAVRAFFDKGHIRRELDEEMAFHIDQLADEFVQRMRDLGGSCDFAQDISQPYTAAEVTPCPAP